jgi:hypothetical protein
MPKDSVCAEIGVWKGDFTRHILKNTLPKLLHLIDPWMLQPEFSERLYGGKRDAKKQGDMDQIYESIKQEFEPLSNISIHRGFSGDVLREFPDCYFDWIYIDGNHEYDYVLKDLEIGFLKVKPGGVIHGKFILTFKSLKHNGYCQSFLINRRLSGC